MSVRRRWQSGRDAPHESSPHRTRSASHLMRPCDRDDARGGTPWEGSVHLPSGPAAALGLHGRQTRRGHATPAPDPRQWVLPCLSEPRHQTRSRTALLFVFYLVLLVTRDTIELSDTGRGQLSTLRRFPMPENSDRLEHHGNAPHHSRVRDSGVDRRTGPDLRTRGGRGGPRRRPRCEARRGCWRRRLLSHVVGRRGLGVCRW